MQFCVTNTFHNTLTLSSTHNSFSFLSLSPILPKPSCSTRRFIIANTHKPNSNNNVPKVKGNKENVWSVDNQLAKLSSSSSSQKENGRGRKQRGRKIIKKKRGKGGRVIVTGAMLLEVETVLQTQVPFFFLHLGLF